MPTRDFKQNHLVGFERKYRLLSCSPRTILSEPKDRVCSTFFFIPSDSEDQPCLGTLNSSFHYLGLHRVLCSVLLANKTKAYIPQTGLFSVKRQHICHISYMKHHPKHQDAGWWNATTAFSLIRLNFITVLWIEKFLLLVLFISSSKTLKILRTASGSFSTQESLELMEWLKITYNSKFWEF